MRLEIGSNIDNKRVRLDFRKDNTRAVYMPSYQIKTANADEFVTKYNKQYFKDRYFSYYTSRITFIYQSVFL